MGGSFLSTLRRTASSDCSTVFKNVKRNIEEIARTNNEAEPKWFGLSLHRIILISRIEGSPQSAKRSDAAKSIFAIV